MPELDRRASLARTGRLVAAASLAPWTVVRDAQGAVDPRLRALARDVRGPVITRSDPRYDNARLVFDERYDAVHPLAIVRPVSFGDVRAAVDLARRNGIRIVARSGGHSYGGYSTTSGL